MPPRLTHVHWGFLAYESFLAFLATSASISYLICSSKKIREFEIILPTTCCVRPLSITDIKTVIAGSNQMQTGLRTRSYPHRQSQMLYEEEKPAPITGASAFADCSGS
jgi:hypothetical protein